jgi:hypothetical protein
MDVNGDILNFVNLCDPEKEVKSETPALCHV